MDNTVYYIDKLQDALDYAMKIIENYQLDIEHSEWTGVSLAEIGFCQGIIYKDALVDIRRRAGLAQHG